MYLSYKDLSSYKISFELSNYVWVTVLKWDYFSRDTIGKQFVRAIDSVSSNIAEGFGRYSKKDKICFYRYSFASILESEDWNEKSRLRKLITVVQYEYIQKQLNLLPKEINGLIKFTNTSLYH